MTKTKSISIQEIDNFSKIKRMKPMEYDLEKNEDDIKELFKKIAGEKGRFTDSPVEKNDLLTYLTMNGKKFLVAFAFKGKSKKKIKKEIKMTNDDIAKRLDVLIRLFLDQQTQEGKMKRADQLLLMDSIGLTSSEIGKILNQEAKNVSSQINAAKKKTQKSKGK